MPLTTRGPLAARRFALASLTGLALAGGTFIPARSDEPAATPAIVQVAGEQKPADHVKPGVFLSVDKLPPGKACKVAIVLEVEEGWHVNTNPAHPDFLVPTTVKFTAAQGTELKSLRYPRPEVVELEGVDEPLHVLGGKAVIVGTLMVPASAAGKTEEMTVEVKFQTCNDSECLPPKTLKLTGKLPVAAAGAAVTEVNGKLFKEAETRLAKAEIAPAKS